MEPGTPIVGLDEATYFLNVAVIAGALIGLSFIALNLFMVDMLTRYEKAAFPVFRNRETDHFARKPEELTPPESLTDLELLDGDPLVVFMAYSVAVSWSLFLLPLLIGLSAAWGMRPGVFALEMFLFSIMLVSNFRVRNQKVKQLKPYLTREELLWPLMSGGAFVLYASTFVVLIFSIFPHAVPVALRPSAWLWQGYSYEQAAIILLKTSCLACLVLGTYTVNKDMFIFYKAASAERMRDCWLKDFLENKYPKLNQKIHHRTLHMPAEVRAADSVWQRWSSGPSVISNHDSFKEPNSESARLLWKRVVNRDGDVPIWMLDVPSIACWFWEIERDLKKAEGRRVTTEE
jgi:hypothetical protein